MGRSPVAVGKSSFDLIDQEALFSELDLAAPITVLDVGCRAGNYALALAGRIDAGGRVIGMGPSQRGVETLLHRASHRQLAQVEALVADVGHGIPLPAASVDLCLMATVYHELVEENLGEAALRAVSRVLRPEGRLAVLEFKRMDGPPGPPRRVRICPNELRGRLAPFGFQELKTVSLGAFVYMSMFYKCRDNRGFSTVGFRHRGDETGNHSPPPSL